MKLSQIAKAQSAKYLLADILAAMAAWTLFFTYRKTFVEPSKFGYPIPLEFNERFWMALLVIPGFWVLLNYLNGSYRDPFRRSRLKELWQTFSLAFVAVLVVFFALLLDDDIPSYRDYYQSFGVLFGLLFGWSYPPRLLLTSRSIAALRGRRLAFETVLVGSGPMALAIFEALEAQPRAAGNRFLGFLCSGGLARAQLERRLPCLGDVGGLRGQVSRLGAEEALLAFEPNQRKLLRQSLTSLEDLDVVVKLLPDLNDILDGRVRISNLEGMPLAVVNHRPMTAFQENLKRLIDVLASALALALLLPLFALLALGVKLSSPGPVFYSHERVGRHGRPFRIFKFRSMVADAERSGPALSSSHDSRVTGFGRFMRKTRLDELPQFFNVLRGDMSLVGPRPERQHFIDQIVERAPHYRLLHKVRPGITSWGQVKFGYAENVDQMVERLGYDLIYLENMSLYEDFKILIHTVMVVLRASGK